MLLEGSKDSCLMKIGCIVDFADKSLNFVCLMDRDTRFRHLSHNGQCLFHRYYVIAQGCNLIVVPVESPIMLSEPGFVLKMAPPNEAPFSYSSVGTIIQVIKAGGIIPS